jgi:hypothetical protein
MLIHTLSSFGILFSILTSTLTFSTGSVEDFEPPEDFYLVTSSIGTRLYRKDYAEGNPDFVQVIDLTDGAGIELQHGGIAKPGTDRGEYGNDNPKFFSQRAKNYWTDARSESDKPFCVTNGQFFFLPEYPTKLAYPLKIDGQIISDGFGTDHYPWQKLMLEIWEDRVNIRRLSRWALEKSTAPDILAGLSEDANKKAKFYTGRTFLGIDDRDNDKYFETVYIFNSLTARQVDAASVLREFGADEVMMLDGGGSTQLLCQGVELVKSDRLVPQAILTTRGDGPYFSFEITSTNQMPLFVIDEPVQANFIIFNNGAEIWQKDQVSIVIDHSSWGGEIEEIQIDKTIFPGQSFKNSVIILPAEIERAVASQIYLKAGDEFFQSEVFELPLVFLSGESAALSTELRSFLIRSDVSELREMVASANTWLNSNEPHDATPLSEKKHIQYSSASENAIRNAAWVPASIFLLSLFFSFGIIKSRK